MSWLSSWRNKWVRLNCATIFRQTLFQSFERRATLIQRNADRRSRALDNEHIGCTKSLFEFFVRDGHGNGVIFCCYVGVPARSARLHTDGIVLSPTEAAPPFSTQHGPQKVIIVGSSPTVLGKRAADETGRQRASASV